MKIKLSLKNNFKLLLCIIDSSSGTIFSIMAALPIALRTVLLLKLSPLMFILCYVLAAVQGAKWPHSLLIAVVGTAMCLGAAGLYKLRGSKSASDLVWLNILLRLFTR